MSCLGRVVMNRFPRHVTLVLVLAAQVCRSAPALAEDPAPSARTIEAVRQMREEVGKLKVAVEGRPKGVVAELRAEPILRYTDPQREFPDATLWVWTIDGRPALFSKLERMTQNRIQTWQFCLSAVNDDRISVRFGQGIVWKSKAAGLKFQAMKDQPPLPKTTELRLAQMRSAARRFNASTTDGENMKEEMRLLTQPMLRYSSEAQSILDGAVFGIASNGTNPDALMLIQYRKSEGQLEPILEYGFLGMSADEVTVTLDGVTVFTHARRNAPGDHGHWLWLLLSSD